MKKSTIWMLTSVMAFAFIVLLYLQVQYIVAIFKSGNELFEATVRRSLEKVAHELEKEEARKYLEDHSNSQEANFIYKNPPDTRAFNETMYNISKHYSKTIKRDSTGAMIDIENFEQYSINGRLGNLKIKPASQNKKSMIIESTEELQKINTNRWVFTKTLL
ncbi:MAG: two-component sensor histidine kinase, partial [Tannerella sp.]|nr:two-component sensor histidine kinase [Tannerella sp.]